MMFFNYMAKLKMVQRQAATQGKKCLQYIAEASYTKGFYKSVRRMNTSRKIRKEYGQMFFFFKLTKIFIIYSNFFLSANKTKLPFSALRQLKIPNVNKSMEKKWVFSYIADRNIN